jgi:transcriptional regulator with XRE-family HTH domain
VVGDNMSLGEKILKLRKKKGLSQEELGDKIKVTRQTISNWELNETSPNPSQLKLLSRELGVSIDELLDNDIKDIVVEKVSNTEKLSKTILVLLKVIICIIIGIVILWFILVVLRSVVKNNRETGREIEKTIHCKLYGEEHSFGMKYYELTGEPFELGGDTYFADILDLSKYNDANQILNVINDYVKKNGGTCEVIENKDLNELITMYIKEKTLTNTSATIVIESNTEYDIMFGEPYKIEKFNYNTNEWESLPIICNNCAFIDIGYILEPNKPIEKKINWESMYGKLPKGEYRIVKDMIFTSDTPTSINNDFYIWTEFSID